MSKAAAGALQIAANVTVQSHTLELNSNFSQHVDLQRTFFLKPPRLDFVALCSERQGQTVTFLVSRVVFGNYVSTSRRSLDFPMPSTSREHSS